MRRLAVIPARGGTKRVPRKNVRFFAGRPMITYAIDLAKGAGVFDTIVVSTDDPDIAEVSRDAGAEIPFVRPPDLSDDQTPTLPVVQHAILEYRKRGQDFQAVCCIYPCVPLLIPEDLQESLRILENKNAEYVFPVVAFPSAIQRALRRTVDGVTSPFLSQNSEVRTQDLEASYYDAGQFYWGRVGAWLQGRSIHTNNRSIILPITRAIDIDTLEDWQLAETLFALKK